MVDLCEVCSINQSNPDKGDGMIICDDCDHYFDCMSEADNGLSDAWSNFEKANPDKKCTTCMDCGEWVALKEITENDSCSKCGGDIYDEDEAQEPAND
ncbi:hypothetical protein H0920_10785 [Acinetobacter sp. C_4_1]|uniref:hypothetical protein n=1 Tax=unclassified Acinetobacter TaxID=196816 RepID=UPI0021B73D41|nr:MULTISPECIES: hypothetical protein [unclassified Acinetobacter]MCT8090687.1 hypothetical protein [Acinetobacter sp. F_3_1]MCT8101581.1 hypothetical protein [Acinetobacter sp. C_4_1]MCT8135084.1 hypothetical protein [Acinetobacter sp. T_3_1]